jgi:AcrR family transcriptional regulator
VGGTVRRHDVQARVAEETDLKTGEKTLRTKRGRTLPRSADAAKRKAPLAHWSGSGKPRAAEILAHARNIFVRHGDAELTVRRVADAVGMKLSNVQYYFRTKEELLRALFTDIVDAYRRKFNTISLRQDLTTLERLTEHVTFLIEDTKNPTTNAVYFELWSIAQRQPFAARLMDEMYAASRQRMEAYLRELNPRMASAEIALRSALVIAQIEGLMIFLAAATPKHRELVGLERAALSRILDLAAPDR